jgi:hypothetical protein
MSSIDHVPAPMAGWLSSLPSQNVGTLYAKLKPPMLPAALAIWKRVDGWGQLCDGRDHRQMVHLMLYNRFPNRGKGWTYLEWRAEPDNPEACKHPLSGKVENPEPYDGIAYH